MYPLDGGAQGHQLGQISGYRRIVTALGGGDDRHLAGGQGQDLGVEQIGFHRVLHRHLIGRHFDEVQFPFTELGADLGQGRLGMEEGLLVEEEHILVAHRDHVVVEHPLIDHLRVLLNKYGALFPQAVQAGDGLAGLQGLAGRVALGGGLGDVEGAAAIDEQLDPGLAVGAAQPGVVGGPLVTEVIVLRQVLMVAEVAIVVEHRAQDAAGHLGLQGAVELVGQVGGGEMDAAILGVGARRDGGGVGGPHAGGRVAGGQHGGGLFRGLGQHAGIVAGEAEAAQGGEIRPLLRRQHPLRHAELGQRLHLAQPLLGRLLRIGRFLGVALGRHVAIGETGIVVGGADQAVEVDLEVLHDYILSIFIWGAVPSAHKAAACGHYKEISSFVTS
ncbi:hypothetical protein D3C79_522270 [compost metagenome]